MEHQPSSALRLQAVDISKQYGNGVRANQTVCFSLEKGQVHALLGENGAGKSTFMKVLYGLEQPDSGQIFLNGEAVEIKNSADAIRLGIGMVHQELLLIPDMTVTENVMLGGEVTRRAGWLDRKKAAQMVGELAAAHGFDIDPAARVGSLPIGVQQRVEIIKLLYRRAEVLILDEPTALLTPQESDRLFEVIRSLRAEGKSIIFITHKLREVYQIADCMTVMRGGRVVGTTTPAETPRQALAEMMVGKSVAGLQYDLPPAKQDVVLAVQNLCVAKDRHLLAVDGVSFDIRAGEVLGVAGIEGNGQTQLAQALLGLVRPKSGRVLFEGRDIAGKNTRAVRELGVGSVPDDRQNLGLVCPFTISQNLILNIFQQPPYSKGPFWLDTKAIRRRADDIIQEFDIRAQSAATPAGTLSGGNQQKVVVGRELSVPLKLVIASQPTRGVDIVSATFIQKKLLQAAADGAAVLLISSDLDELIGTCSRVMVMLRGQNVGVLPREELSRERLGGMMLGLEESAS